MNKQVFTLPTTCHMNAEPWQDEKVHKWLINQMSEYARRTAAPEDPHCAGREMVVIIEVFEA